MENKMVERRKATFHEIGNSKQRSSESLPMCSRR